MLDHFQARSEFALSLVEFAAITLEYHIVEKVAGRNIDKLESATNGTMEMCATHGLRQTWLAEMALPCNFPSFHFVAHT